MLKKETSQVHNITDARVSTREEQEFRVKFYLVSMLIRTLCFVGAIVAGGVLRWVLVAGAIFLPYVAVVVANASREKLQSPILGLYLLPKNGPKELS